MILKKHAFDINYGIFCSVKAIKNEMLTKTSKIYFEKSCKNELNVPN